MSNESDYLASSNSVDQYQISSLYVEEDEAVKYEIEGFQLISKV